MLERWTLLTDIWNNYFYLLNKSKSILYDKAKRISKNNTFQKVAINDALPLKAARLILL